MKILLIENDRNFGEKIKTYLEKCNYDVTYVVNIEDAFNYILLHLYDVYLLNINSSNNIKLIKLIRHKNANAVIVAMSSSKNIEDMKKAYGENYDGCDDYFVKPFEIEELMLKINRLLKIKNCEEAKKNIQNKITIDNMEFYLDTLDLYIDGVYTNLRKKEKKLLAILLKNINKTVPKEEIIKYVWKEEKKEYPLRQLISELKSKLPKNYIVSIVGIGYRFEKR